MIPVIQEEQTGCTIACAATIAGISYQEAKKIANSVDIYAEDPTLWSDTNHIQQLLLTLGVITTEDKVPFTNWESIPDCALLSI